MNLSEAIEKLKRDLALGLAVRVGRDRLEFIGPDGSTVTELSLEVLQDAIEEKDDWDDVVAMVRDHAFDGLGRMPADVLCVSRQFANYCDDFGVDPIKLLRQFMADVCSGDGSQGSNERDEAKAYLNLALPVVVKDQAAFWETQRAMADAARKRAGR